MCIGTLFISVIFKTVIVSVFVIIMAVKLMCQ